ncbi:MAG: adenylosuccinate synthase [Planctomycetota bacterium]
MPATVIVGLLWGDEGKAKVLDAIGEQYRMVVRFQGGSNAGHTVIVAKKKYAFHLVPSGVVRPGTVSVIGSGVVVDPFSLAREIKDLIGVGVKIDHHNLKISDRAHLVLPYHPIVDRYRESLAGTGKIGTTGRGIGPAYADKAARIGVRVCDILEPEYLRGRLDANLTSLAKQYPDLTGPGEDKLPEPNEMFRQILEVGEFLKPFITDTMVLVNGALDRGEHVLFEGAQGTLLDVDHGTYPFVTSSSVAHGAGAGSGVPNSRFVQTIGVLKAYATRVGSGPFPTELPMGDTTGDGIRDRGHEFGTTTGRPRRVGWFDAVAARYAVRLTGANFFALNHLDTIGHEPVIRVCTKYILDGKPIADLPASIAAYDRVKAVYEDLPGWPTADLREVTRYDDLPAEAKAYVARLSDLLGIPAKIVSVGPGREQTIVRD